MHPETELEGVGFERLGRGLRIVRRWEPQAGCLLMLWVAVWLGLVGFLTSLGRHRDIGFTAVAVLPGILMAYAALTRFFNRTVIELTPESVTLRHTPLPWPGRRRFAAGDIRAVRTRVPLRYDRGGPFVQCWISVERANGRVSTFLKGLEMPEAQMTAIADAMASQLGVPLCEE